MTVSIQQRLTSEALLALQEVRRVATANHKAQVAAKQAEARKAFFAAKQAAEIRQAYRDRERYMTRGVGR
jgi:hypothetical protein